VASDDTVLSRAHTPVGGPQVVKTASGHLINSSDATHEWQVLLNRTLTVSA
jgi:hypothetical protein